MPPHGIHDIDDLVVCVEHPDELRVTGIPVRCPACGARRDWLLVHHHDHVFIRCRCAHQWHEPDLDTADFDTITNRAKRGGSTTFTRRNPPDQEVAPIQHRRRKGDPRTPAVVSGAPPIPPRRPFGRDGDEEAHPTAPTIVQNRADVYALPTKTCQHASPEHVVDLDHVESLTGCKQPRSVGIAESALRMEGQVVHKTTDPSFGHVRRDSDANTVKSAQGIPSSGPAPDGRTANPATKA